MKTALKSPLPPISSHPSRVKRSTRTLVFMAKPGPTGWPIGFVSVGYPWRESSRRISGGW